ncbi:hypothetical protein [Curtobacterium sp. ME26]|uniref:hypothetical protein n=1 Tax=Curtobacterium sp. ME26 TaxID=2744254 RepID=UPI0015F3D3F2|nr:hypothetical protein [Curtobacterium sp. ME26]
MVIVRADDFALAIARAEDEAARYAVDVDAEYLGLAQAFALVDDPDDGAEVFSLMRDSDLPPDEYLDAFSTRETSGRVTWGPPAGHRSRLGSRGVTGRRSR